jgi:hypothetical protein
LEKAKLVSENGQLMMFKMEENEREFCFTSKEGFAKPAGEWITVETPGENTQHNGVLAAFASVAGFWSVGGGLLLLMWHLARLKSLGVPYIRLFEPGILRKRMTMYKQRNKTSHPVDKRKQK